MSAKKHTPDLGLTYQLLLFLWTVHFVGDERVGEGWIYPDEGWELKAYSRE